MTKPTVNIIGAGKLGKTIMKLIVLKEAGTVQGVCNSSLSSSKAAVEFIGQGKAYANISNLPAADITFITTPDDSIEKCSIELSQSKTLKQVASLFIAAARYPPMY
jgi:prephenate dehydrogenase